MTSLSTRDAVHQYITVLGAAPIPIPARRKSPIIEGWPNLRISAEQVNGMFADGDNVGVLLGDPSGGLVDIDIDAPEALLTVPEFLPQTDMRSGRAGKPRSHWWYRVAGMKSRKFQDPLRQGDGAMLVEIRSPGCQTLLPPSMHPSGDLYVMEPGLAPASVGIQDLELAVAKGAAAAELARHWPAKGSRHEASLALSGMLFHAGWPQKDVEHFVVVTARAAGDEEAECRVFDVWTTAKRIEEGLSAIGGPTLSELIDEKVTSAVRKWLRLKTPSTVSFTEPSKEIPRVLHPVPAFALELLPPAIRPFVADIAERQQSPIEFVAVSTLVSLSAVVGRRIGLLPKRFDDWLVVPNLWGAVIGPPGAMKTPALEEPMRPLKTLEAAARAESEAADDDYAKAVRDAKRKAAEDKLKQAAKAGKEFDDSLRDDFTSAPPPRRYRVNDATVEKLGMLLAENPKGLLVFRDELTGWLRSLDREDHQCDRAFYLEAWNGTGDFTYDRVLRGTLYIPGACVSVLGGIQPGPFRDYLAAAIADGRGNDGLVQRLQLAVYPDPVVDWVNVDRLPDEDARQNVLAIFEALDRLRPEDVGAFGKPIAALHFSFDAQEFFDAWRGDLERQLRSGIEHPALESHLTKYRSLMPSLALLFHLVERVLGTTGEAAVSLDSAQRAAAWCSFLEAHARRIYGLAANASLDAAFLISKRFDSLSNPFSARDIQRKGWSGLTKAEAVYEALGILEDNGWVKQERDTETGGRDGIRWFKNPNKAGT